MNRSTESSLAPPAQVEELSTAVNRLADELGVLRQVLDEFRAVFAWAVRNDKFRPSCVQQVAPQLLDSSDGLTPEPDDDQREELAEVVQDSLRELAGDLEEVVRDQLKQELAGFRDSIDQFPIDIQWAVSQVRQVSSDHQAEANGPSTEQVTWDDTAHIHHPAALSKESWTWTSLALKTLSTLSRCSLPR